MRVVVAIPGERREGMQKILRAASYLFLALGVAGLGYASNTVLDLLWFQYVETSKLDAVYSLPAPPPVQPEPIAVGDVIGELEAPGVGLKAVVVEGDSEKLLRRSVGHLSETAMPGEPGNVTLAGHRDGLFRPLRNVQPGDTIILRTRDRQFKYQVEWTAVVPPTATQMIQPTTEPALTLVTCYPFYYVGAAPDRFVVRARPVSIDDSSLSEPATGDNADRTAMESAGAHSPN